jgi:hypothetical protein
LFLLLLLLLLQVSDVGPVPERLQEGHVITVEPGVYFMPLLLQRAFSDPKKVRLLLPAAALSYDIFLRVLFTAACTSDRCCRGHSVPQPCEAAGATRQNAPYAFCVHKCMPYAC